MIKRHTWHRCRGSGSGADATTTTTCSIPAGFSGFAQTVSAVGDAAATSGGPLTGTCVLGETAVTATLVCNENQGGTSVDRSFALTCPAGTAAPLTSTPVSGSTVLLPTQEDGGAATTASVSFQNPGATDAEVTCALTGAPEFAVAPASVTVPAAGSATTTVTFDAATPDDYTGTLTCSSGAQTFTFPLEATAAAPGEVPLTSTPASGSTITLPQQTVGGAGTTATVSFGNDNVFGLTMECSIFGDEEFSVAPESFTVPAAGNASVTVTLDSAAAGSFDGTLLCNAGKQTFSFPLFGTAAGTVTPQPPTAAAVIPAMGDAVRGALMLLMLGLGLLALHRTRR